MGMTAALKLRKVSTNLELILGLELLCAAQGIDFRRKVIGADRSLGRGSAPVYSTIREAIPFIEEDEYMKEHLDRIAAIVSKIVIGG